MNFEQKSIDCRVEPILDADLGEVCEFLRLSFLSRGTPEVWLRAFQRPWHPAKPNNGFMLRSGGQIVGALGAIYSEQFVEGKAEAFCNLTSWFVREEFRRWSLQLFFAVIGQAGFHFTDLTANPAVVKILLKSGFRPLSGTLTAVANIAIPNVFNEKYSVYVEASAMAPLLSDERRKICLDHADCGGIRQIAIGNPGDGICHIVYTKGMCRGYACAIIHDVSDVALLVKYWPRYRRHLLYIDRCVFSRIETRILDGYALPFSFTLANNYIWYVRSKSLKEKDISPLYSELMALHGC